MFKKTEVERLNPLFFDERIEAVYGIEGNIEDCKSEIDTIERKIEETHSKLKELKAEIRLTDELEAFEKRRIISTLEAHMTELRSTLQYEIDFYKQLRSSHIVALHDLNTNE